jgi:DNA-binding Lrp family transcriptional regulator
MGRFEREEFMNTAQKHVGHAIRQVELLNYLLNNLSQFNLKPTTKLVLLYLAGCYNPKHADVFPKQKTIALQMGISEASVIRAIQELHKEGLIISERKYTNRYKFTSRILNLGGMVEDFLEANNMQVENSQNAISETCNLQAPYIEQEKEQKKEQTYSFSNKNEGGNVYLFQSEEDRILEEYARPRAKKSVQAYVKRLKESGSAAKIISEYKMQKKIAQIAQQNKQETKTLLQTYQEYEKTSESYLVSEEWKKLGQKFGFKRD